MLPDGKYIAQVTGFEQGYTQSGKEQLALNWKVIEGPEEGSSIASYHYFSSEKAQEISFKALEAAGWDGADICTLDGLGSVPCEIVVQAEEYNGKWSPKVKWVNKIRKQGEGAPQGWGAAFRKPKPVTATAPTGAKSPF